MTLQTELLVDRRKLKRKLSGWRFLAIVFGLGLIAALFVQFGDVKALLGQQPHVARVTISGFIRNDREQQELLARVAKARNVRAVIVSVDSRGGTTAGGESLYEAIRELAEKKPVVAVLGTIATSAGYMVAIASDHIVARNNTITGSVGVIVQWPQVNELLKNLGIKVDEVRSGELKANPSPFRPVDEAGRAVTEEMVKEAQTWFLGLVAQRRLISPDEVPGLTEGRIYSGRMAKDYKLVDALGGEKVATAWLEKERQVPKNLKIIDWKRSRSSNFSIARRIAAFVGQAVGLSPESVQSILSLGDSGEGGGQLDGLLSLWHPRAY